MVKTFLLVNQPLSNLETVKKVWEGPSPRILFSFLFLLLPFLLSYNIFLYGLWQLAKKSSTKKFERPALSHIVFHFPQICWTIKSLDMNLIVYVRTFCFKSTGPNNHVSCKGVGKKEISWYLGAAEIVIFHIGKKLIWLLAHKQGFSQLLPNFGYPQTFLIQSPSKLSGFFY